MTGGWRKLHNEELHNLYSSPNTSRMVVNEYEMGMTCSTNGEKQNPLRIMMGQPEGKRLLGRPGRIWVDNIKMDLREIEWDVLVWTVHDLAQERDQWRDLLNTVMNLRVP
jgi:hypothetical protein